MKCTQDKPKGRAGRAKVKSGCKTCKIRKVKCDEGRPACNRCISTGRVCDGYGIWGGGGNHYGSRKPTPTFKTADVIPWRPACSFIFVDSAEARLYLEWFQLRTIAIIPGIFDSRFWESLLLQISMEEPAVLHAILTLSSVHKRDVSNGDEVMDQQDRFMLRHYNEAIQHLNPIISMKDTKSVDIGLVTCVIFICIELLRGRFQSAQTHLKNGIKVLEEILHAPDADTPSDCEYQTPSKGCRGLIDDRTIEALSQLNFQLLLYDPSASSPVLGLHNNTISGSWNHTFCSFTEAWHQFEVIWTNVLSLTHAVSELDSSEIYQDVGYVECQRQLQEELSQWLMIYRRSKNEMAPQRRSKLVHDHILLHHSVAVIMAGTCLSPSDESSFDFYTDEFTGIVERASEMWKFKSSMPRVRALPGNFINMAGSIIDLGWIPPLYYTGMKCRVHSIRSKAIAFLESSSHREGFWDAKLSACVARRAMEVEEFGAFSDSQAKKEVFDRRLPDSLNASIAVLPAEARICDVKLCLPDGPFDTLRLCYRYRPPNGTLRLVREEYDISSQCWANPVVIADPPVAFKNSPG